MNSRVVGIIKFELPQGSSQGEDRGLSFSDREGGLTLERWLSALVGASTDEDNSASRWDNRSSVAFSPRLVRANLEQLAAELNREYLGLAAT